MAGVTEFRETTVFVGRKPGLRGLRCILCSAEEFCRGVDREGIARLTVPVGLRGVGWCKPVKEVLAKTGAGEDRFPEQHRG